MQAFNGRIDKIKNHETPWGIHKQGGFIDRFRTPLAGG
jgi:hypothetical protein